MAQVSSRVDPGRQPYLRGHSSLLVGHRAGPCVRETEGRGGTQDKWMSVSP